MKLNTPLLSILLTIFGALVPVQAIESVRNVDFNNFTYSLRSGGLGPSGSITLSEGQYRTGFSWVAIRDVYYSDINGDNIEDAVVVLSASGGGSGVSTHAFGFTDSNGSPKEILYLLNFITIQPYRNGFTLVNASPSSTGPQNCAFPNTSMRINAVNVETYQWDGARFIRIDQTTVRGQQVCNFQS